ncbi:MAG: HDIG domain-containing metalloprotein [Anaerolineales bacterium]
MGKLSRLFSIKVPYAVIALLILVAASGLALLAIILPIAIRPSSYSLSIGDVAPEDIRAPRSLSYTSEVLTERARQEAAAAVSKIYLPTDPTIARTQIERLRSVLNFITAVRMDKYATLDQKLSDLRSLSDVKLEPEKLKLILNLPEARWDAIQKETLSVLEQAMRKTILEDEVAEARRNLPPLVSFSLSQEQVSLVVSLVSPFVVPNSLYSEELTEQARQAARDSILPVQKIYITGEMIVSRGQIIKPEDWEALQQFGLIRSGQNIKNTFSTTLLIITLSFLVGFYFRQRNLPLLQNPRALLIIAIMFLVFLYGARVLTPNRAIVPYFYPLATFGLTISCLFSTEVGLILAFVLIPLAAYGLTNELELILFYQLSVLLGVLALNKGRRFANFIWAGLAISITGSVVILVYRLPNPYTDWIGVATLVVAAFLNGLASASLTLLLQYLISQFLGLTTALQLLETLRPDHPLLKFMLQNAPGSYQHSLQVANLAEQAAETIGADSLLVRAGAIYHDVGKAANPLFFIENQIPGNINPHDDLDPVISAETIIRHVSDGVQLARKFRLPPRVVDFINEHHGTLLTRYQYARAIQIMDYDIDESKFRYPGPIPRSKETALLMLADGCEARARAELPKNEDELRLLIDKVFEYCIQEGQLDQTPLTLLDLSKIKYSFLSTMRNVYHPRIQYPDIKKQRNNYLSPIPKNSEATIPSSQSRK